DRMLVAGVGAFGTRVGVGTRVVAADRRQVAVVETGHLAAQIQTGAPVADILVLFGDAAGDFEGGTGNHRGERTNGQVELGADPCRALETGDVADRIPGAGMQVPRIGTGTA